MNYEFETQFKSSSDIRIILDKIKMAHAEAKQDTSILARASIHPNTGTIYKEGTIPEPIKFGIRINKDYLFSPCLNWIFPDDQKGLSFSASWKHLNKTRRMIERFNKYNSPNNVWWVTKSANLPNDMKFVQDRLKSDHYFLTVTEKISVRKLYENLVWIGDRMSIIKNVPR